MTKISGTRRANRRPKASQGRQVIGEETRFGSRHRYKELKRRGYSIPKDKLIKYMKETGKSMPNPNKQRKRKRCRYERDHSFSLVHGDFHRRTEDDPYAIYRGRNKQYPHSEKP